MTSPALIRAWFQAVLVADALPPLPADSDLLLNQADEEGVLALLASALAGYSPCPDQELLRAALHKAAVRETAMELERMAQARRALAALADAGISALVLKGTALAYWLYAAPAQRPRCDMDVLVADRTLAQCAVDALLGAGYCVVAGAGVDATAEFEVALERRSPAGSVHTVDLHWRLLNHAQLSNGFSFDELWAARIGLDRLHPAACGLGRVHALVHALLHRITNFPGGKQNRLIWLYDIHLLAGRFDAVDWQQFLQICRQQAIAQPCLDGLHASRDAFRTAIPVDVATTLAQLAGNESWQLGAFDELGALDRAHLAALSWPEKAGWLWRKLLPSPEFMRYRYGVTSTGGLVRAYLLRWWVGVRRALGGGRT